MWAHGRGRSPAFGPRFGAAAAFGSAKSIGFSHQVADDARAVAPQPLRKQAGQYHPRYVAKVNVSNTRYFRPFFLYTNRWHVCRRFHANAILRNVFRKLKDGLCFIVGSHVPWRNHSCEFSQRSGIIFIPRNATVKVIFKYRSGVKKSKNLQKKSLIRFAQN